MDGQKEMFETFVRSVIGMTSIFTLATINPPLVIGVMASSALIVWAVFPMYNNLRGKK